MELDYDTRPLSIAHQSRNWNGISNGISAPSVATTSFVARRRSTAVHALPPGPPPSQPIPNLPVLTASHYGPYDGLPDAPDFVVDHDHLEQQNTANPSYARPAASPGLAAVAAFSQARYASASTFHPSPSAAASSSTDNLSDSPPRSMLRPIPNRSPPTQNLIPDRLLLSPTEPRPVEPRPSSRRALTKALELAREAVRLDSTNDDPYGAVMAYGKSVALLSEVMERVMRGEDSTESHRRRNGRRRSVVAQEEEVKRLKSIHDTYADRMNILSVIYSIPLPSHSPPSTYASSSVSVSSDSTQPSSPSSTSPTSDTSEPSRLSLGPSPYTSETTAADELSDGEAEAALGTSVFTNGMPFGRTHSASAPSGSASPVHPYALQSSGPSSSPPATQLAHRPSVVPALRGRPRASSTLLLLPLHQQRCHLPLQHQP
ncbi:hypothetical protein A0H81_00602 [Grifola frondosa]|uniref:MIT domain-containing protein n=1 Tax=Grifola frondosa TaxID=5627 RepID=A0A1C7MQ18_GRIFR|nr:hypothetical protein A0H81_00602 [Grifola frondosa]